MARAIPSKIVRYEQTGLFIGLTNCQPPEILGQSFQAFPCLEELWEGRKRWVDQPTWTLQMTLLSSDQDTWTD
jgi:hypothetical protein